MQPSSKAFLGLALWLLSSMAGAAVELKADHPERYTVKKGDTLWDIAGVFLQKPWRWPEIWHKNSHVRDPHWIYPGDELVLRYRDGQPVIEFAQESSSTHPETRELRLAPQVRSSAHTDRIPPIPLDAIWPFLSRPRVVGPSELAVAPYIVSSQDEHLISGPGTRIYVRGFAGDANHTRYTIFRCGEVYRRPSFERDGSMRLGTRPGASQVYQSTCMGELNNPDVLGYEAIDAGDATVVQWGDPAIAVVSGAQREILVGDRLLPQSEPEMPEFVPHPPDADVRGTVLSVLGALSQVGPYQTVVIDLGSDAKLQPGHVLGVSQSGIVVDDKVVAPLAKDAFGANKKSSRLIELPNERIGELMVFRVFEHVSYALVMRAERSVHVGDAVRNPD